MIKDISKVKQVPEKKIHIYHLNKIKEALEKVFEGEEEENGHLIGAGNRATNLWIKKAKIPIEYQQELLSNIRLCDDNCCKTLEDLGWTILKGKELL